MYYEERCIAAHTHINAPGEAEDDTVAAKHTAAVNGRVFGFVELVPSKLHVW